MSYYRDKYGYLSDDSQRLRRLRGLVSLPHPAMADADADYAADALLHVLATRGRDRLNMKALVTGGAGFIGHHLARAIGAAGGSVIVLDNPAHRARGELAGLPNMTWVNASVVDRDAVFAACRGRTHVFHLAALVSVPESVERPIECVDINCRGYLNVLDAARAAGNAKVVLSSSAAIYGRNPRLPSAESDPPAVALRGDETRRRNAHRPTPAVRPADGRLRYFNVFGGQRDSATPPPSRPRAPFAGRGLTIFGTGEATRDFSSRRRLSQPRAATSGAAGVYAWRSAARRA
jgi:UDP-glucose 4-epimerase